MTLKDNVDILGSKKAAKCKTEMLKTPTISVDDQLIPLKGFEGLQSQSQNSPFLAIADVGAYMLRNFGLQILSGTKYRPQVGLSPAETVTGCLFGHRSSASIDLAKSLSVDIHQAGLTIHRFIEISVLLCRPVKPASYFCH